MSRKVRVILTTLIVISLVWASVVPYGALEIKRYYGDVDNDGFVTTVDARIVLMIVAGIYDKTLIGADFAAADMDNDGKITTLDARMVLKTAAGQLQESVMVGYEFSEHHEEFVKIINDYRFEKDHKSVKLTLSNDLCEAARLAAQEYALKTNNAFVREDGTFYYTLLDELGIQYTYADKVVVHSGYNYANVADELLADIQSEKMLAGDAFTKIGVGAYSTDNRTFYWCVFVTR